MREIELRPSQGNWIGKFRAMGSPCELICETSDEQLSRHLTTAAAAEAWRVEDKFSRYLDGNIVARINSSNGKPIEVDDETARLVDFAVTLYEMSEHRFDITSGALRKAWTFDGSDEVPGADVVAAVMQHVGWHRVDWVPPVLTLPDGMEIDLGGIGKEYAVDKVALILRNHSDRSCLVNFGGDLVVTCVPRDKPYWSVGIESVDSDGEVAETVIQLRSGAIATSGDARRYLLRDEKRYGHILDPSTGWPVEDAPRSVTVAAESCVQAGMLSTLAMLKGPDAEAFLGSQDTRFWCYR